MRNKRIIDSICFLYNIESNYMIRVEIMKYLMKFLEINNNPKGNTYVEESRVI